MRSSLDSIDMPLASSNTCTHDNMLPLAKWISHVSHKPVLPSLVVHLPRGVGRAVVGYTSAVALVACGLYFSYQHRHGLLCQCALTFRSIKDTLTPAAFKLRELTSAQLRPAVDEPPAHGEHNGEHNTEECITPSHSEAEQSVCAVYVFPHVSCVEFKYTNGVAGLSETEEETLRSAIDSWCWAMGEWLEADTWGKSGVQTQQYRIEMYHLIRQQYAEYTRGGGDLRFPETICIQLNQEVLSMLGKQCMLANEKGEVVLSSLKEDH
jgi:hypothetical protein